MTSFVVIISMWVLMGFSGLVHQASRSKRTNIPMILFMLFVPFIPLVAAAYGLY